MKLQDQYAQKIISKFNGKQVIIRSTKYICFEVVFKNKQNQELTRYVFLGSHGAIRWNTTTKATDSMVAPLWFTRELI